jgi:hypothetical protein
MKARLLNRGLLAVSLGLLGACGGGGGSSGSNATLNLNLIDAPVDGASAVVVQFTGVELKPRGGNAVTLTFPAPKTIDLLQQQNGNAAVLLQGATVPAGDYEQIRLLVDVDSQNLVTNSFVTIDGAQFPLRIPSGEQTGLKLVQGFTFAANGVANFTVDFNVRQALVAPPGQQAGQTQIFLLRPALRLIDNLQVGTLTGTVAMSTLQALEAQGTVADPIQCFDTNGMPTAHAYIFSGSSATLTDMQTDVNTGLPPPNYINPVVTPNVLMDGTGGLSFTQSFLVAGPYTVAITCSDDDPVAADALIFTPTVTATVGANQTATVSF